VFQFGGQASRFFMHRAFLLTVESSSEVRQGVLTFRCVPCISAYSGVKFGGQARSSDVYLWSVHFCLRWSQGRRSDKELRCLFVHRAFVPTVKSKFLCAPCICTYGELMLLSDVRLIEPIINCLIFFIFFLMHYNFEIFQTYCL